MTDTIADNPAVARRQLGFLETFDKKYEGFRRELERLERLAAAGGPPAGGWPTEGLERIARGLVGAGAVYGLPTVTTWARGFLERLDAIHGATVVPSSLDFSFLAEQIGALTDIEAGLTRAARMIVSPATAPSEDADGGEIPGGTRTSNLPMPFIAPPAATEPRDGVKLRWTPVPPSPSKPPPRPSAPPVPRPSRPPQESLPPPPPPPRRTSTPPSPPADTSVPPELLRVETPVSPEPVRVETPVPPEPSADSTVKVPSLPPSAPPTLPDPAFPGPRGAILAPGPRDERLVSRAWQVLAVVALLALGFSLWFNYRLFASFDRPDSRAPVLASDPPRSREASVVPSPGPLPDLEQLLDAGNPESAADTGGPAAVAPQADAGTPLRPVKDDGYRRGGREDTDNSDREEPRRRRRKRIEEAAEKGPPPAADNPYGD